jgi:tyrosyl-tRNA synthetase
VSDEKQLLTSADLTENGVIKLSLGKKRHALIRPV